MNHPVVATFRLRIALRTEACKRNLKGATTGLGRFSRCA